MAEQLDGGQNSFGDFSNLFPNLDQATIHELIEGGFAIEKDIVIGLKEENGYEIFKRGVEVKFLSDDGETHLTISVDKDTGKIYNIDQFVRLPINIYEGANAGFALFYTNYIDDLPHISFDFNSGDVFGKFENVERLDNLYVNLQMTYNPLKGKSDIHKDKINLIFRNHRGTKVGLDAKFNTQNGEVSMGKGIILGKGKREIPGSDNWYVNNHPYSLFLREENPWKMGMLRDSENTTFGMLIPEVMEILGDYKVQAIPNFLDLFKSGQHRPIIPFRCQFKMLK